MGCVGASKSTEEDETGSGDDEDDRGDEGEEGAEGREMLEEDVDDCERARLRLATACRCRLLAVCGATLDWVFRGRLDGVEGETGSDAKPLESELFEFELPFG